MKRILFLYILILLTGFCLAASPKRIVSLSPSATKSLYLMGADKLLVGCTSFCMLEDQSDAQIVASAVQVNIEKTLLLKPDLIVANSLTKPETLEMFRKLGIETVCFPYPKSFDELCRHFTEFGKKVGKEPEANRIITEARRQVDILRNSVPQQKEKPKVFFQIGANPLFTAVPKTFMQDFIDFAGCRNIASDMSIGSITRETVLVRNPDVIFVMLMGSISAEEKDKWKEYKSLSAVKNNKIFVMDSERTCSPTPLQFADGLREMIQSIYSK